MADLRSWLYVAGKKAPRDDEDLKRFDAREGRQGSTWHSIVVWRHKIS